MRKYNQRLRLNEPVGQAAQGRYGLAVRTQEEVAHILHVTKQAVQQIELKALRKLASNHELKTLWMKYKNS